VSKSQPLWERARILTDRLLAVPPTAYQQRSLGAAFSLFLNPDVKMALHRAELVSASALSRFFNEYDWDTTACWTLLRDAQWDLLLQAAKRKHHPCLRLSVDLTSVPKTGRQLPFVRVYNEVHGIHLVILFAHYGTLKFPVGYRVYRGKGTPTPVTLARDLLRTVPHTIRTRFRVRVLADSGFEAAAFLDEVRTLGFEFVVGVRSTRRTDHPGVVTVADCPHGGYVELQNWPHDTLTLGRVQRGQRVFHAVSSELMEGDEVISEGAKRWQIESFFKESKHQFGLNRFALRTARGLDRWLLLIFVAWTLTLLGAQPGQTLASSARRALLALQPELYLNHLLHFFTKNAEFLGQHGYSLSYARCNF
jgi:hypothetical protein